MWVIFGLSVFVKAVVNALLLKMLVPSILLTVFLMRNVN